MPPPTSVKGVRIFLGYAGFYRHFIKDFSLIAKPLTNLLIKDVPFVFDDACMMSMKNTYFKHSILLHLRVSSCIS